MQIFIFILFQISRYFSDPHYYFQVNDQYVRNKLKVVLFPFLHRVSFISNLSYTCLFVSPFISITCVFYTQGHWTRISEPVGGKISYKPPIYDINAPDLYIPFMAFGTYVVLCGLFLGLQGKYVYIFSPFYLQMHGFPSVTHLLKRPNMWIHL